MEQSALLPQLAVMASVGMMPRYNPGIRHAAVISGENKVAGKRWKGSCSSLGMQCLVCWPAKVRGLALSWALCSCLIAAAVFASLFFSLVCV